MIDGILELDSYVEKQNMDFALLYKDLLKIRREYLLSKFGLGPKDSCVYIRKKKAGLYIGSSTDLAKRYQNWSTIESMVTIINYGPYITENELRLKEQETIDNYKKQGYTLANKVNAYRRRN